MAAAVHMGRAVQSLGDVAAAAVAVHNDGRAVRNPGDDVEEAAEVARSNRGDDDGAIPQFLANPYLLQDFLPR